MKQVQLALGSVGLAIGLYGLVLLMERPEDLVSVGTWLIGGVVLHDALLAPLVIGLCLLGARLLPQKFRASAAMSVIVFGSITLIAIPVLGRFGAKEDNPTLLDRNYLLGWALLGALTLAGTLTIEAVTRRRAATTSGPISVGEVTEEQPEEA